MQQGIVKWFNAQKGFGFIGSEGKDYFAHYKDIKSNGFRTLEEGQKVRFDVGMAPKGPIAKNIYLDE